MIRVGVISDTHGRLPEAALEALTGVDAIVHAGDVGGDDVLLSLEAIAPVTAVRGNTDHSGVASHSPDRAVLSIGGVRIAVRHSPFRDISQAGPGIDVLVSGHTHRASVLVGDILMVDPGSATRPRGGDPATVAVLMIEDGQVTAEIIDL